MSAIIANSYSKFLLLALGVATAGLIAASAAVAGPMNNDGSSGMPPPVPLPVAVPNTMPGNAPVPVPVPGAPGVSAPVAATPEGADPSLPTPKVTELTEAEKHLTLDSLRNKLTVTRDETWVYRDRVYFMDMLQSYRTQMSAAQ